MIKNIFLKSNVDIHKGREKAIGMIGYYYQADDVTVHKLKKGESAGFVFAPENEHNLCCIDKAWHAIHYTLTGEVWEIPEDNILGQLVLGGVPVNDEDMGYGPMRLLDKGIVSQIVGALEEWDETAFRDKFNLKEMAEMQVYPIMDGEDEEQFFQYVWENLEALKAFIKDAAQKNQNILTFLG